MEERPSSLSCSPFSFTMAECRNFFHVPSAPSMCPASSSAQRASPSTASSDEEEAGLHNQGLELRLGLSSEEKPPQHHMMVRPVPVYPNVLNRQRSESFAAALENVTLLGTRAPVATGNDKANLFSPARTGSAFSVPQISRDQVWQTLQRGNAVLGEDVGLKPVSDATSLLASRRSTSMQITIPPHDVDVVMPHPIRRSSSSGIPEEGLISCADSLSSGLCVNERSTYPLPNFHRNREALELQWRKEVQAHRRLEARKRRWLQLEEKQQKKALQGRNSRECILLREQNPHVCAPSVDTSNVPSAHWKHEHVRENAAMGKRGNIAMREDAGMAAPQASNFSETESVGSKEDNAEVGSRPGELECPCQKSSTDSNNDHAPASGHGFMPMLGNFHTGSAMAAKYGTTGKRLDFWGTKSFNLKKSVGVFCEGKWKTSEEISDISSIRRTTSNINQVVSKPPCSFKAGGS